MIRLNDELLSPRFRALLREGPKPGRSNVWLLQIANYLAIYGITRPRAVEILSEFARRWIKHREVPLREIEHQVEAAYRDPLRVGKPRARAWSAYDPDFTRECLQDAPRVSLRDPDGDINSLFLRLFGDYEVLVCVASRPWVSEFVFLGELLEDLLEITHNTFIVPNPFRWDANQRIASNIQRRVNLVLESDEIGKDDQLRLYGLLSKVLPLKIVVDSGKKSFHGWFDVEGKDPVQVRKFFDTACRWGFDRVMWSPVQFCRMPFGVRYVGNRSVAQRAYELDF